MPSAAHEVEVEFYPQRQPHLTREPDVGPACCGAEWRLSIHSKSIGIHLHHAMICPGLGVEPEKLRIAQNPTGGSFGCKFSPIMEALLGLAVQGGAEGEARASDVRGALARAPAVREALGRGLLTIEAVRWGAGQEASSGAAKRIIVDRRQEGAVP